MSSHETERKYTQSITLTQQKTNSKRRKFILLTTERRRTQCSHSYFEPQRKEEHRELSDIINHREKENTEKRGVIITTESTDGAEFFLLQRAQRASFVEPQRTQREQRKIADFNE